MPFWDAWFKPKCADCSAPMDQPVEVDGRKICPSCHDKVVAAKAKREAELQARLKAEEEARARLEKRQSWGGDPRMTQG